MVKSRGQEDLNIQFKQKGANLSIYKEHYVNRRLDVC